ncbi:hypothetical protein OJ253_2479 [Cryptosporidium canis]|uniref:Uncharacterized protein n=1 Tax=Cryptosporidium canis TaxID=195482 RepID=A0A9D5DFF1_9CRYT|nr:hypothetical protein OJ253_2479 [Cryptosporidium canis]
MLYIVGEWHRQSRFFSELVASLEGGQEDSAFPRAPSPERGRPWQLPPRVQIKNKYYSAEADIKSWTLEEYLELKEYESNYTDSIHASPEAILLVISKQNFTPSCIQSNSSIHLLLSALDQRYPPSKFDITRLCCAFQDQDDNVNPDLRDLLSDACNQLGYEFITILPDPDSTPSSSQIAHEDDVLHFSQAVQRAAQALHCTNWKTMHKQQIGASNPENHKHLESCLDNFELLSSMMKKMTANIKHLTDHERRERASNLIHDIVNYLNLDESDLDS